MRNFAYNLLKFFFYKWKGFCNSICDGRIFNGVEFKNSTHISIAISSSIEKGSVLKVSDAKNITKKIIIKDNCWIGRNVEVDSVFGSQIFINDYVSIQDRCKILGSVNIGKYCILAPDIFISSGNHYYNKSPFFTIRQQDYENVFSGDLRGVTIEEDCWIGKNVFIAAGVYIGRGSIIGTNSIIRNDIEPYSVNIGSPAIKIKERISFKPLQKISPLNVEDLPYFYRGFEHYVPNENILNVIRNNSGIRSENKSLVLLERKDWVEITVKGYAINQGTLKMCIDENSLIEFFIEKNTEFAYKITKEEICLSNDKKYELPFILKKYFSILFEFASNNELIKYNFIISNIIIS